MNRQTKRGLSFSGLLVSHEEEQNCDSHYRVMNLENTVLSEPDTKDILRDSIHMRSPELTNPWTENTRPPS